MTRLQAASSLPRTTQSQQQQRVVALQ
jgi:hypothetical protein